MRLGHILKGPPSLEVAVALRWQHHVSRFN